MIKRYKKYILTFLFFVLWAPIVNGWVLLTETNDLTPISFNNGILFWYYGEYLAFFNENWLIGWSYIPYWPWLSSSMIIDLSGEYIMISTYQQYSSSHYITTSVRDMYNTAITPVVSNTIEYSGIFSGIPLYSQYNNWAELCINGVYWNNITPTVWCPEWMESTWIITIPWDFLKHWEYWVITSVTNFWDSIEGFIFINEENGGIIKLKEIPGEILNWKYVETGFDSFLLSVYWEGYWATSYNVNLSLSGGVIVADTTEYPDKVIWWVSSTGQLLLPPYSATEWIEEYDFAYWQPLVWVNDYWDILYIYNWDIYLSQLSITWITPPTGWGWWGGESQGDLDELLDTNFIYDKDGDGSISFSEAIQAPFVFFWGIFNLIKQWIWNFYEFIIKFQKLSPNIE